MSNIFKLSSSNRAARKQQVLNLETIRANQVNFYEKSLRALVPKIWNNLPPHIKSVENLPVFKCLIKYWYGFFCQRNLCKTFDKWASCFLGLCLLYIHKHNFTFSKLGNDVRVGFNYFLVTTYHGHNILRLLWYFSFFFMMRNTHTFHCKN